MAQLSIYFGAVLILIGFISYFATGQQSVTALIPAFFGTLILISGILALKEKFRKISMHSALIIALLGFIGTVPGLLKLVYLIGGDDIARPAAVIVQSLMATLCVIYICFGIKSFINARRKN